MIVASNSDGKKVNSFPPQNDIKLVAKGRVVVICRIYISNFVWLSMRETPLYWMDFGNTQSTGQVVLGTVPKKIKQPVSELYKTVDSLKVITRFVKYARVKEEDSGPSCSLAEALEKQDLFINSTLAQLGCNILWKMFRNGMLEHHGLFLNLDMMKVNPINL